MAAKKKLPFQLSAEQDFKLNYINVAALQEGEKKPKYYSAYGSSIQYSNVKLILEDDYYRPEIHMHIRFITEDFDIVDVDIYIPWWEAKKLAKILDKLAEGGRIHDPAER